MSKEEKRRPCVIQVSAVPPPIGGNTVHVLRLHKLLLTLGYRSEVLDYLSHRSADKVPPIWLAPPGVFQKLLFIWRVSRKLPSDAVVHFHVSCMGRFKWLAPFFFWCFRSHRKILTIHSGSFAASTERPLVRGHVSGVLRRFDHVVLVSHEQAEYVRKLGLQESKFSVIPAFLPQIGDPTELPSAIDEIPEHTRVVLTSGYLTEIYNYDVLLDAIAELSTTKYFFVFAFYNTTDPSYERRILGRIARLNHSLVLRDLTPAAFVALMERCDIYVRPTTTDGDAVAVREALYFGKTVLASDAVERPAGCDVYPTKSSGALASLFRTDAVPEVNTASLCCAKNIDRICQLYEQVKNAGPASS